MGMKAKIPRGNRDYFRRKIFIAFAIIAAIVICIPLAVYAYLYVTLAPPFYGQQEGAILSEPTTIIAYNVTIPNVTDSDNNSAFLINAVTNAGYWFQLGIETSPELSVIIDEQLPTGNLLNPEVVTFNYPIIHNGDKVLLEIYTAGNATHLYVRDPDAENLTWNAIEPNTGSSLVALSNANLQQGLSGAFTGVMSEYHYNLSNPHVRHQTIVYQPVNYTPQQSYLFIQDRQIASSYSMNTMEVNIGGSGATYLNGYSVYTYSNGTVVTK